MFFVGPALFLGIRLHKVKKLCIVADFVGLVAQSVEQRIENPRVGGSIPPQATTNSMPSSCSWAFSFVRQGLRREIRPITSHAVPLHPTFARTPSRTPE